ncbi:sensor histidine kinase [Georgenia sp. Z1491]|uniref:sensor histidine kinase n=1 Tax=Georgenia sp. Z1491 TaxID=3416707 RepID=UPI003CEF74AC
MIDEREEQDRRSGAPHVADPRPAPAQPADRSPTPAGTSDVDEARSSTDPWDQIGWLMAAIWLVFLIFPVLAVLDQVEPVLLQVLDLVLIAVFAVVYCWAFRTLPECAGPDRVRHGIRYLAVLVVLAVTVGLSLGFNAFAMCTYLVALAIYTFPPLPGMIFTAGVLLAATLGPWLIAPADEPWWLFGPIILLVAVACFIPVRLDERADRQRRLEAELTITAERDRVARDVHDVLGHSLTVITVKSELAERLVDVDPGRAKDEIAQVRSLSRQALAEIRATVAGLRVARLVDEREAAQVALAGAGIAVDLPGDADVVDPRHRITLAWALREAVTNVVRHSGASRCTVRWSGSSLVVDDDGRGTSGREGNGLRGLRERVRQAGGTVTVGPGPDGTGTRLEVLL